MKKGFIKGTWRSIFKKVAIATFAFAALFMLNTTAVYASETNTATQEQTRSGGRVSTEREERVLLPRGIHESRTELEQDRNGRRTRTEREERILLPSGIRESRTELEILRSGNRNRTEREERILLPSGIRERMAELEFERSGTRGRTERESRSIRNGLLNAS